MKIHVKVDPDLCIGAASCVTIGPETFQLNEANIAVVLDHGQEPGGRVYERDLEVTQDEFDTILLAAQSCPTLAISIFREDGTQAFPEV